MSQYVKKIRTEQGDLQIDYNALANLPDTATASSNGLMTSEMVTKLNGIDAEANNYTLPTAGKNVLGGVKTTSSVTSASGYTACPIISGVPYYKDTNTTYTLDSFGINATAAELNYVDGVTANIQTQLNWKVNENLLINSNFKKPVNQRGSNTYTGGANKVYTIDRWCTGDADHGRTVSVVSGGVKITNPNTEYIGTFQQLFEHTLPQGTYTVTVKVSAATGNSGTIQCGGTGSAQQVYLNVGTNTLTLTNATISSVVVYIAPSSSVTIEWIKLECGAFSTPFVPKLYAEELALCQRYYEKRILMFFPLGGSTPSSYYVAVNGGQHFAKKRAVSTASAEVLYNQSGSDSGASIKAFTQTTDGLRMIQLNESSDSYALRSTIEFDAEIY